MALELPDQDVPGLLALGTDGFELAGILLFAGTTKAEKDVVRDAVFAHTGQILGDEGDGIRVHAPARVKEIARTLAALPDDTVAKHYESARRALAGKLPIDGVEHFTELFEDLRIFYAAASDERQSVLTLMT